MRPFYGLKPGGAEKMTEESVKKIRELIAELQSEIEKVIRASVSHVIEIMFHDRVIVSDTPPQNNQSDVSYVLVEIDQQYIRSVLRFGFDKGLLRMMVKKIYNSSVMIDQNILEDAACEIANIISKRVKALMNTHGMAIHMSIPYIERPFDRQFISANNMFHIHFLLDENQMGVDFACEIKAG